MGKYATIEIKESVEELKNLLKRNSREVTRKRLRALLHLRQGTFQTRQKLADELGIHIRTLERWLVKYKSVSLQEFISIDRRNRSSRVITHDVHRLLEKKLNDNQDPLLGYADALDWIREQTGIQISYHNLRHYLIRHFNSKLKVPRKSHVKKDIEAEAAFLKTAWGLWVTKNKSN